jgi:tetratricopeptide (TPR) repeat protein
MGYALELLKNYSFAIKAYEKTITLDPTSNDARIAVDRVLGFMKSTKVGTAPAPASAAPTVAPSKPKL